MGYGLGEDLVGRISKWTWFLMAFGGFGPIMAGVGWKEWERSVSGYILTCKCFPTFIRSKFQNIQHFKGGAGGVAEWILSPPTPESCFGNKLSSGTTTWSFSQILIPTRQRK
ncbi:hypothetical protein DL95DRAFT_156325 [Leptodontidium sp. 2 PMI_412]|nr:hypothetical protein DL95DRAFT_156325 [Leptodontidium sp. 2 PMI_412]